MSDTIIVVLYAYRQINLLKGFIMLKKWLFSFVIILGLVIAGCSDDANKNESTNYSEEINYTITGLEPGAGQTETNEVAIDTYDSLTGWTQDLSSTGAMLSALDEAIKKEEPIMITAWSPHYMFAKWDIKYLEDPEGVYGEAESVHTLTRLGLKEDNPDAYTILERIKFELEDVEEGLLEAQDREFEDLTRDWVDDNQEIIEGWIKGVSENNGDSIELVTTPWDDALFSSNVAKHVLSDHGFDAHITSVDPAVLFESIAQGEGDATLSPWLPSTHGVFYDEYEGKFEDIGVNLEGAQIGLAVPSYMEIDSLSDLEPKE